MKLLTNALKRSLPPLGATEGQYGNAVARVKFFTPWAGWKWYVLEFDKKDTFFGLVVGHETELGYFSLRELKSVRGPFGLRIERDLYFEPVPLCELPECPQWLKEVGRAEV